MQKSAEAGLTLVEMLVVLAIIGISIGAMMLGLGVATRRVSTEAEAHRLAARIQLAADDAMVTDKPIGFSWDTNGYSFSGAPLDASSFAPHALPSGIRLAMDKSTGAAAIGADGSGTPIRVRLTSAAETWLVVYDGLTVRAAQVRGS